MSSRLAKTTRSGSADGNASQARCHIERRPAITETDDCPGGRAVRWMMWQCENE